MPKNKFINLLPQEEFEGSTLGRVLRWAMGSFRIIVIVTEMIVMGAFLSRFWLDAKNSSVSESIKIASSQIQVQSDFEKRFRQVQTKLSIFKQINTDIKPSYWIQQINQKVPAGIIATSISVGDTSIIVKGDADSENSIMQFISNIKNETGFKKIDLGSINSSENNKSLISFEVTISIN